MGVDLVVDTDEPSIDRDQNDFIHFIHYSQRAESDTDDDHWLEKLAHPDNPVVRVAGVAMSFKAKCGSVLSKVGVSRRKLKVGGDTGKCRACDGMEGFYSWFPEIEVAAAAGCPSCNILMQGIKKYTPDKRALSSSKLTIIHSWNSGCAGRQFVRTKNRSAYLPGAMGVVAGLDRRIDVKNIFTKSKEIPEEALMELNFFGVKDDPASWNHVGLAYHISGDTSSHAAFRWFQDRLDRCIRGHSLCKTPYRSGQLPSRVLDLGSLPGAFPDPDADVRLIESKGFRGRYVCLSYCWGGTIDIRLTKDRYESYTRGIDWAILPQGYRDAIHLTRKLGVRYIWIDSLCITQDDEDDWREQASNMAPIYQGAHVTIAATKATSPSDGYFSTSPPQYQATRLSHRDSHGATSHAYVRRTIPHFFSSTAGTEPNYSLEHSPLLRRGWVFQERLLSPRILHLGTVEMAWECNEVCACECMGETQTYASEPRWAHTKGSHARNLAAAKDESDVQPDWRSTVENYTRTLLTFDKDVFPAISGVVKNMQRYRTDRYLAGVWEASVLEDLAWQAANNLVPRPKTWLAPTWSWASVTSPVHYLNYRTMLSDEYIRKAEPQTQRTVLLEASVTPAGSDPTAEVSYGELVLLGPLIEACLQWPAKAEEEQQGYGAVHGTTLIYFISDYDLSAPGPGNVPVGSAVYFLFLCREPELKNPDRASAKPRSFSLVLRRVDEGEQGSSSSQHQLGSKVIEELGGGTYERIGIYVNKPESNSRKSYVEENGVECVVKLI
ncbi:putative het domain-containing protein [Rosellinia necatrix]|uniref:Putative het domain-containing protein n=1 Tax=Rosellinia necatrix TaxID=77044 RepID=A0A1W2TNE4_ROSNE|nr:putative het domain-containing protein [Rosellinia necatrix]